MHGLQEGRPQSTGHKNRQLDGLDLGHQFQLLFQSSGDCGSAATGVMNLFGNEFPQTLVERGVVAKAVSLWRGLAGGRAAAVDAHRVQSLHVWNLDHVQERQLRCLRHHGEVEHGPALTEQRQTYAQLSRQYIHTHTHTHTHRTSPRSR